MLVVYCQRVVAFQRSALSTSSTLKLNDRRRSLPSKQTRHHSLPKASIVVFEQQSHHRCHSRCRTRFHCRIASSPHQSNPNEHIHPPTITSAIDLPIWSVHLRLLYIQKRLSPSTTQGYQRLFRSNVALSRVFACFKQGIFKIV